MLKYKIPQIVTLTQKGFWLMSSLTALFVIFSLMLFLYNEYERDT